MSLIEDNMPAHKLFQRPMYTVHMTHKSAKAHNLGVPGDAMTFQTNFIAMVDHVGTHVDAFRHVSPDGKSVDEMPLDLFMGKAVCFDLRHIPDLGEITIEDMETSTDKPTDNIFAQHRLCRRPGAGHFQFAIY
jgi:kynurenine formamidase